MLLEALKRCRTTEQLNPVVAQLLVSGYIHRSPSLCRLINFLSFSRNSAFVLYAAHILLRLQHPLFATTTTTTFLHNTVIRGYSLLGLQDSAPGALLVYSHLLHSSKPDNFTFPFLLKALTNYNYNYNYSAECLSAGKQIHAHLHCFGFQSSVFVLNTLIKMYSSFRDLHSAQNLFDFSFPNDLDVVSWNTLIHAYVESGDLHMARHLFDRMPQPNHISWTSIISAYAHRGQLDVAHSLFHKSSPPTPSAAWNSLIAGYAKSGLLSLARQLFDEMPCRNTISWNSMISAYAHTRHLEQARSLFDQMPEKDVFSWSCMISGYAQNDQGESALQLFQQMLAEDSGCTPNEVTLLNVLAVCARLAALHQGVWIHTYIQRNGMRLSDNLGASLIDMYAKCGCVETAVEVFRDLDCKNVSCWNALITGLAVNGVAEAALEAFTQMQKMKTRPNNITFLGVLMACCHGGLVEEGRQHFESMENSFGVEPEIKHYGCMIDLLGRAGLLEEAEEVIRSMPMEPDLTVLGALLGACRIHGNVEVANRVCNRFLKPKSHAPSCRILLSHIYAAAGRWTEASRVRATLHGGQVKKEAGLSSLELLQANMPTDTPNYHFRDIS
ncbi:hypothetical protein Sjap_001760 [Stephania japonica]|uniref:Pentatricopeptide repeat-containing protein n=1 Tax=Stephania japonica TaxID=461633 RepID=A0AAP0KLF7_9MAGN